MCDVLVAIREALCYTVGKIVKGGCVLDYSYHYSYSGMDGLAAMLGVLIVLFVIAAAVGLLFYILRSIGLMTLANNRGLRNPWLAWIPVVGVYTLGAIVDDISEKEGGKSNFRYLMLGGSILSMLFSGISSMSGFFEMLTDPEDWLEITGRNDSGYVTSIRLDGESRSQGGSLGSGVKLTGRVLRESILGGTNLRSTSFDFKVKNDKFVFTVQGYGHGVGMSQTGANEMAREGYTYDEILTHYYPGTEVA